MGFLKFLKRSKENVLEEEHLDVPPDPPDIGSEKDEFPEMPEPPKLPKFPVKDQLEFEPIPDKNVMFRMAHEDFLDNPINKPPIAEPALQPKTPAPKRIPIDAGIHGRTENLQKPHKVPAVHLKEFHKPKSVKGSLYVRIDNFRDALDSANSVKNDLKMAGKALTKLSEIDARRDVGLEKLHSILHDAQKELLYIDKTLFKGDRK